MDMAEMEMGEETRGRERESANYCSSSSSNTTIGDDASTTEAQEIGREGEGCTWHFHGP